MRRGAWMGCFPPDDSMAWRKMLSYFFKRGAKE